MRDIDVACLIRETVIHSDIKFDGFDHQKALCYLRLVAGEDSMRKAGLGRLIPIWKGGRVESLCVTGDSAKNMDGWKHSLHEPTEFEIKRIIGL